MSIYVITGPDGKKYRVTAPEGASQDEVLARVRSQASPAPAQPEVAAEPQPVAEESTERRWFDRPRALIEGATWGIGDELGALAGASMAKIDQLVTGRNKDQSFGDIYREMHGQFQDESDQYEKNHGGEALALNLVGGLTTGGVGIGRSAVGRAVPILKRTLAASGAGAAEGAIAGVASADQGLENRVKGGLIGAGLGAATAGVLTGIGGGANAMTKRRIAQDLIQPDGRQMPIHLAAAPNESAVADIYRNTIGGTFGGAGALQRKEKPFLDAAEAAVESARAEADKLTGKADLIKDAYETAKLKASLAAQDRARDISRTGKEVVRSVQENAQNVVAREASALRKNALNEALTAEVPPAVRQKFLSMSPQEAAENLDQWWSKNGFSMVKNRDFEWTGNLKNKLDDLVAKDPTLALELGDVWSRVPGMTERMQAAAMKIVKPGQALTTEDAAQALRMAMQEPTHINGEALMAMRNFFARASNDTSKNFKKGALRQVANVFDDEIRSGLGKGTVDEKLFNDHIKRWGSKVTYEKAVAAAEAEGGLFTPKQYLSAGGKGKKAAFGKKPLQQDASRVIAADRATKRVTENVRERVSDKTAKQKQALKIAEKKAGLALAKKAAAERAALKKQGSEGLKKAKEAQEKLTQSKITPSNWWQKTYKTTLLGGAPALFGPGAAFALPAGIGISKVMASDAAQRAMAGQTQWQKALARDLRMTQKEREILGRALRRGVVQQTTQED